MDIDEIDKKNNKLIEDFLKKNFKNREYILHFSIVNQKDDEKGSVNISKIYQNTIHHKTSWYVANILSASHQDFANKSIHALRNIFNQEKENTEEEDKTQYG